jgi:hypothetical protein
MGAIKYGSFPRSGNHFLGHLFEKTLESGIAHYIEHYIFILEKDRTVTTIRTPLECVPSWIVLMNDTRPDRAEKVLEWYCAYYDKCKELEILIIPFTQLISDPLFCLNHVFDKYDLGELEFLDYDLSTDFHFPTKDKSGFDDIIEEMQLAPSFSRAMSLFEELCVPVG